MYNKQSILLTNADRDACHDIADTVEDFLKQKQALDDEYMERYNKLKSDNNQRLRELSTPLYARHGLDYERDVLQDGTWNLDLGYLKIHGIAFLVNCGEPQDMGADLAVMPVEGKPN